MRNFNSRTELALRCATKLDTTSGGTCVIISYEYLRRVISLASEWFTVVLTDSANEATRPLFPPP